MKIVAIFADKLFAVHYSNQKDNELKRILKSWSTPIFLVDFVINNSKDTIHFDRDELIECLIDDVNALEDIINNCAKNDGITDFDNFFKPLNNNEYREIILSERKGRQNFLRLYAIKIDKNCYLITGGAIKFPNVHNMRDRPHLQEELNKLNRCKTFLKHNNIFDKDSFFELINSEP